MKKENVIKSESKKSNFSLIEFLIENGSDLNINDKNGESCLMLIAKNKNFNLFKSLIRNNKKLNTTSENTIRTLIYLLESEDEDLFLGDLLIWKQIK